MVTSSSAAALRSTIWERTPGVDTGPRRSSASTRRPRLGELSKTPSASRVRVFARSISVLAWPFDAINHQHFDWASTGLEPKPKLLLHRREDRWPRRILRLLRCKIQMQRI